MRCGHSGRAPSGQRNLDPDVCTGGREVWEGNTQAKAPDHLLRQARGLGIASWAPHCLAYKDAP